MNNRRGYLRLGIHLSVICAIYLTALLFDNSMGYQQLSFSVLYTLIPVFCIWHGVEAYFGTHNVIFSTLEVLAFGIVGTCLLLIFGQPQDILPLLALVAILPILSFFISKFLDKRLSVNALRTTRLALSYVGIALFAFALAIGLEKSVSMTEAHNNLAGIAYLILFIPVGSCLMGAISFRWTKHPLASTVVFFFGAFVGWLLPASEPIQYESFTYALIFAFAMTVIFLYPTVMMWIVYIVIQAIKKSFKANPQEEFAVEEKEKKGIAVKRILLPLISCLICLALALLALAQKEEFQRLVLLAFEFIIVVPFISYQYSHRNLLGVRKNWRYIFGNALLVVLACTPLIFIDLEVIAVVTVILVPTLFAWAFGWGALGLIPTYKIEKTEIE